MQDQARIGCSGWVYRHWRGDFYPQDLPAKRWFAWYAQTFDTCEINGSFYRLPSEAAVKGWADAAPEGFVFAWKASRYITHNKKLNDCQDSVDLVFGRMDPLGDAFGPVLFQLPPMLHRNDARLARFLSWLPKHRRCVVEFRHPSWYAAPVMDILAAHDVAMAISDHHDAPAPWETPASFVYWRGHGPGGRYHGRYRAADIAELAQRLRAAGRPVYGYFDNDVGGGAPKDAKALLAALKP
jgi:uncharacterized protein YecE (DUF72 family)